MIRKLTAVIVAMLAIANIHFILKLYGSLNMPKIPQKGCSTPATSVAFAKTHKSGSTTIQNILLRYGYQNNLTVALPLKGWMFNQSVPFHAETMVHNWSRHSRFNLFVSHSHFDLSQVRKVVGKGAKIVTILRDPLEVFESGYVYFGLQKGYNLDINEYTAKKAETQPWRRPKAIFGKNQLLYNLGMSADTMESQISVEKMIAKIDQDFDLVMLMERMEESIVLLKHVLCWNLQDVRHFKLNERLAGKKSRMSGKTREKLKQWLSADYKLYNHFKLKFEALVEDFGPDLMREEVAKLRKANLDLSVECHQRPANNSDLKGTLFYMASDKVKGFTLDQTCSLFAISEPNFFKLFRNKQDNTG